MAAVARVLVQHVVDVGALEVLEGDVVGDRIDEGLESSMASVRSVVTMGLGLRKKNELRVRQPLEVVSGEGGRLETRAIY